VAVLLLAMVGYATWQSYDVARRETDVFTARATEATNDQLFDRAMRYALQAYPARGQFPWITPFSTELEAKLAGGAQSTRLHRVLEHPSSGAAFSNDGNRLVTVDDYNYGHTARIWDAEEGKEIAVLEGHTDKVNTAAFSNDGKRVVTASSDKTARIWDAENGKEIAVLKHAGSVRTAAFVADGRGW
jgi:WD40 repeat protein